MRWCEDEDDVEEMDEEWSKAAAQQWEDFLQQWEWEGWEIITLIAVTTNISHLSCWRHLLQLVPPHSVARHQVSSNPAGPPPFQSRDLLNSLTKH